MEGQEQQTKSRVLKIDSARAWDFYVNQATNGGCPVSQNFPFCSSSTSVHQIISFPDWNHWVSAPKDANFGPETEVLDEDPMRVDLDFQFQEEISQIMTVLAYILTSALQVNP